MTYPSISFFSSQKSQVDCQVSILSYLFCISVVDHVSVL